MNGPPPNPRREFMLGAAIRAMLKAACVHMLISR